jgi:hypothetical protein
VPKTLYESSGFDDLLAFAAQRHRERRTRGADL